MATGTELRDTACFTRKSRGCNFKSRLLQTGYVGLNDIYVLSYQYLFISNQLVLKNEHLIFGLSTLRKRSCGRNINIRDDEFSSNSGFWFFPIIIQRSGHLSVKFVGVKEAQNALTIALRAIEGDEKGTQCLGLYLGHPVTGGGHKILVQRPRRPGWAQGLQPCSVKKYIFLRNQKSDSWMQSGRIL